MFDGLSGVYYDYTSLSCAPDGGWTGWEIFWISATGDDDIVPFLILRYQKKWEKVANQSRLQRHSKDIFGSSNNQLNQVRHCSSSTILSQKYQVLVSGTHVENISAKVLRYWAKFVARCPRSARLPSNIYMNNCSCVSTMG